VKLSFIINKKTMKQFHKEVKNISQDISYPELLKLFEQYQETKSQAIRDKIFNSNTKLVFSILTKYKKYNIDDLEQYGFIGLIKSIQNFDPSRNIRFSTYASRCITNEINFGLNLIINLIPIPKHFYKKVKAGEITEISTTELEDIDISNELYENGIDKDLFWLLLKQLCTEEEIDILLKKYCSDEEFTLSYIAKSINHSPQYTNMKIKRLINRLKQNTLFKNKIKNTL
jgi:RNA polymerase sigma factor (sigma-70 family)